MNHLEIPSHAIPAGFPSIGLPAASNRSRILPGRIDPIRLSSRAPMPLHCSGPQTRRVAPSIQWWDSSWRRGAHSFEIHTAAPCCLRPALRCIPAAFPAGEAFFCRRAQPPHAVGAAELVADVMPACLPGRVKSTEMPGSAPGQFGNQGMTAPEELRSPKTVWNSELGVPSHQSSFALEELPKAGKSPNRLLDAVRILVDWLHVESISRKVLA